jgi:hypothetical protein
MRATSIPIFSLLILTVATSGCNGEDGACGPAIQGRKLTVDNPAVGATRYDESVGRYSLAKLIRMRKGDDKPAASELARLAGKLVRNEPLRNQWQSCRGEAPDDRLPAAVAGNRGWPECTARATRNLDSP